MGSRGFAPAVVGLIASAALVGCGGGSNVATVTTTVTQASGSQAPSAGGEAVAMVDQTPIAKATFDHWMAVTAALSHSTTRAPAAYTARRNQVLGYLITSQWVLDEAAHLGVSASEAQVHRRLAQFRAKQFPKASEFAKYLASVGESEADLLQRTKAELLESKISQRVTAAKTAGTDVSTALSTFQSSFYARWKQRTSCKVGYVMEDCREYKGAPHPQSTSSSSATTSGSSSGSSSASRSALSNSRSNASGEVYSAPGAMAVSSSAFEDNGTIPAQYTCDGADTSPPLQWQHLPAHTAELVLFAIDDSSEDAEGGIRWVVAGIDPSLPGIAAGSLPGGAIVGLNSAGKATYGGICPPHGKTASVEFVLWALSKKISLSSGFSPAVAEREYSKSELASAVTYTSYTRG
jgi:Raf kinase inhibitor-like YbhB/YbcL family protein